MNLSPEQLAALKSAAVAAVDCEFETHLPAELTVAQWALESGWGSHIPGNNCFGIKAYPGCFGVQNKLTWEGHYLPGGEKEMVIQVFATFPTVEACFEKHCELITTSPRYARPWTAYQASKSLSVLIHGIAPIYAKDQFYSQKVLSVLDMSQVKAALLEARGSV